MGSKCTIFRITNPLGLMNVKDEGNTISQNVGKDFENLKEATFHKVKLKTAISLETLFE
jgi:hypothetical protein